MRLKLEVRRALSPFIGKKNVLFEDIPKGFCALFEFEGDVRAMHATFGIHCQVYFGFDLGVYSEEERCLMAEMLSDTRVVGRLSLVENRVQLVFPHIVPRGTAKSFVRYLLPVVSEDLLDMDRIVREVRAQALGPDSRFSLFQSSPDPSFMRPPGVPLN